MSQQNANLPPKSPEISIIVPVYKVEKYLNSCIESLLSQTFADFEVILVDDGSPDNCPALCDAAAAKDGRIRVIHQANGGVSRARNAGLEIVRGNWVAFVDPDDCVAPQFLEKLHTAAVAANAEIAICSSLCIDEAGNVLPGAEHRIADEVLTGEETLRRLVVSDFQVSWNKLYRRDIFETLRFPTGKQNEDTFFLPQVYQNITACAGVYDCLYRYRIVQGSIMHSKTTLKTLDWVEAWYRLFEVLYQNGITDTLCAAYRPILTALWNVWLHLTPEERKSPRMQEAFDYERTARRQLLQAHGVTPGSVWAAVLSAASAMRYLELRRSRAAKRQQKR